MVILSCLSEDECLFDISSSGPLQPQRWQHRALFVPLLPVSVFLGWYFASSETTLVLRTHVRLGTPLISNQGAHLPLNYRIWGTDGNKFSRDVLSCFDRRWSGLNETARPHRLTQLSASSRAALDSG